MANNQNAARALGQIAAIAERRIPQLSPSRVARLADDPRQELAVLIRAYRSHPIDEDLEAAMCSAFEQIDGAELPERIDAAVFYSSYYAERKRLRDESE